MDAFRRMYGSGAVFLNGVESGISEQILFLMAMLLRGLMMLNGLYSDVLTKYDMTIETRS